MYLVDYHTHTCCSPDSEARLSDMVRAAQQAGAELLRQDPTLSQPQHERLRAQVAAVVHNVGGQIN